MAPRRLLSTQPCLWLCLIRSLYSHYTWMRHEKKFVWFDTHLLKLECRCDLWSHLINKNLFVLFSFFLCVLFSRLVRTKGVASIIFLFFLLSLLLLCVVVTMLFPPFLRLGWRPEPRSQTCAVYERVSTRSFLHGVVAINYGSSQWRLYTYTHNPD